MQLGAEHSFTSRKRAFGLDPLVPASIWAGTKGPATSPQSILLNDEDSPWLRPRRKQK
jgi:hypothetical protein